MVNTDTFIRLNDLLEEAVRLVHGLECSGSEVVMSRLTCISCKHFDLLETQLAELDTEGRCRRYPPAFSFADRELVENEMISSDWFEFPIVMGSRDWCGEFKPA